MLVFHYIATTYRLSYDTLITINGYHNYSKYNVLVQVDDLCACIYMIYTCHPSS